MELRLTCLWQDKWTRSTENLPRVCRNKTKIVESAVKHHPKTVIVLKCCCNNVSYSIQNYTKSNIFLESTTLNFFFLLMKLGIHVIYIDKIVFVFVAKGILFIIKYFRVSFEHVHMLLLHRQKMKGNSPQSTWRSRSYPTKIICKFGLDCWMLHN